MTVAELIKLLEGMPQEATVLLMLNMDDGGPCSGVVNLPEVNQVELYVH